MSAIGIVENGKFKQYADSTPNIGDTPITFEQATELANVEPGDSMSAALGKLSKLYAELEGKAAFCPVSTSRDISKEGVLMDGKTVSDWVNELAGKTRIFRAERELGSENWYTIVTNREGIHDVTFGGSGLSGLIIISRVYQANSNESYLIAFSASYNNHVVWKCLNSSVNTQVVDKIRIAKGEESYQLDIHYNKDTQNTVAVSVIVGDVGSFNSWAEKGLEAVSGSPTNISVYNIPKTDNIFSFRINDVTVTNGYVEYRDSRILETTNAVITNLYDSSAKSYFYTVQCANGRIIVYIRTPTGGLAENGTKFKFFVICINN